MSRLLPSKVCLRFDTNGCRHLNKILALQMQLQQAQTRAIELNQDAKATFEQRRDEVTRQAIQLGLLAAVLLILLGTALRYAVKWHLELRRRQGGDQ